MQALDDHKIHLSETIDLSISAAARGDEPFGAVLVRNGVVILRAENSVTTGRDKTNHAEMNLVRMASQLYDAAFLAECTLYSSTEPCPMCAGALYWAGIGHVVYACSAARLNEIAGPALTVTSRDILLTGARPVTVIGPTELEPTAAQVHLDFWPKYFAKA